MFFVQSILQGFGFSSDIFAEHLDPALARRIHPLEELRVTEDDVLLIHHSMGHDAFSRLAALRCRKFLIYHNITPPRFFESDDATSHFYAAKGYSQLSLFRDIVESAIAVSPLNAQQLQLRGFSDVTVIPLLKDFAALRYSAHAKTPYYDDEAVFRLLFVGRMARHKCQLELIDFVNQVRSIGRVKTGLALVGHFDDASRYKSEVDELIDRLGLGKRVTITGPVTDKELFGWYRAANAYVSFSEHEGFGVPLVEAMAFDLPVVAYESAAVADTLEGAGVLLADKDPAALQGALARLHEDRRYRAEVIRAQRKRLLRFSRNHIEAELRRWLIGIGACHSGNNTPVNPDPGRSHLLQSAARNHYVVEGPYETSYSLAIVNRNIALALAARDGCTSSIEPADGDEGYAVDQEAAGRLCPEIRELVRPAPITAERIVTIRNTYPPRPNGMLGDCRLLHLAWEESAIPSADLINLHIDGVLAPSRYVKEVIRNSGVRVPIAVIGHGVDHAGIPPQVSRGRYHRGPVSPSLPFTFLHISSGLARKGIEELITAYCLAFSSRDPVLLVIKTFDNPNNTIDHWVARLTNASKYSPSIQIITEELDDQKMEFLYQIANCLVLPTRGEGFNLPAAEGMARGVPLIASRHGGHLDFCSDENAFLIDCTYEFSKSHLNVPNSYWARPSVEQLVGAMKDVYRADRSPQSITAARAATALRDTSGLRWPDVAEKVDRFVKYLDQRPLMRQKVRLGWISTYNARCGIATHSEHLLEFFDRNIFDVTILADDQKNIGRDPDNVLRLWSKGQGTLGQVKDHLIRNGFDAAFFQHNINFYDLDDFVDALIALSDAHIYTFVTFHRTRELLNPDRANSYLRALKGLQTCTRIFVHSLDDVNRLREWGLTDNVVLLTHGVIDRTTLNADGVRSLLGLSNRRPVIGTFGFLLPDKGLTELIQSFALILRAHPTAYLLMVNADYPGPESQQERQRCVSLIRLLEIDGQVRLINGFLDIEEALFLLSACDVIVYPYQRSDESASGAVRLGLAAGRPVLTTPLPVFSDLSEIVYQLPGTEPATIAAEIISLLGDKPRLADILQRQRAWVRNNSWAAQSARLSNIILGCIEEASGVELRPPGETAVACPLPKIGSSRWDEEDVSIGPAFLTRKEEARTNGAATDRDAAKEPNAQSAGSAARQRRGLLQGFAPSWRHAAPQRPEKNLISRADRARDTRNWVLAARYYREALDIKPDNPAIWVQYGHALKEAGDIMQAECAYRRALELDAGVADTHLQLGHALKIQDRKIEASVAYIHALALDPTLDHASFELKGLGWTKGRIQLALRRARSGTE